MKNTGTSSAQDTQIDGHLTAFEQEQPATVNTRYPKIQQRLQHCNSLIHGGDLMTDTCMVGCVNLCQTRVGSAALTALLPVMFERLYFVDLDTAKFIRKHLLDIRFLP